MPRQTAAFRFPRPPETSKSSVSHPFPCRYLRPEQEWHLAAVNKARFISNEDVEKLLQSDSQLSSYSLELSFSHASNRGVRQPRVWVDTEVLEAHWHL